MPSSRTPLRRYWGMPTAVLAVCIFIAPPAHALKGDANGDGQVNAVDARLVADYLVGNVLSIPQPVDADVNGDGRISTADALLILQFSKGLRTTFDFQAPLALTVLPPNGSTGTLLTANISIFFSEPVSTASLSGALTVTDTGSSLQVAGHIERAQDGVIATFFPDQPLSPLRTYRVDVSTAVTDEEANHLQQSFTSTFQTQALGAGVLVSTNNLSTPINELAPQPVTFKALNSVGAPVKQVPVTFTARMGSGSFEPSGKRQLTVLTDAAGIAQASFRVGGEAVIHTVEIHAIGFSTVPFFSVQALPLAPVNLRIYSGNNQSGAPGGTAPLPLIVQATDAGGNPIGGTTVTFNVTQGQGNFGGQPSAAIPTDSSGTAAAFFTFGASSGTVEVEASFQGMLGQAPTFSLLDLIPQPSSPTTIIGKVIDAQTQLPLQHVYVYLADNPTTWDWTDAAGFFRLTTIPGPHTVDVDGFESGVIGGFLYPVVAIPVNAVQGQENDVGMPVLLPRMDVESYIDVSGTQGGTLTLRSDPLWKMYVAPGQAHFANGTTTGRLYVAAVPADRIPMPVAGGKSSRFFDTIQPLNVTFNPPAQVSFPNADNLPPGTVTDIFTLSYSSGTFIRTGRGQVAEDGVVINSLPGEGITQGGWHNAPSPRPSPLACIKAILNLGRFAVAATMTSHGMSTAGKKIADDFWTFLLCNLPSDQGPCNPIVNITNGPAPGGGGGGGGPPPIGGGGGGPNSGGGNPQPPFNGPPDDPSDPDDPNITTVTLSLDKNEISGIETAELLIQVSGPSKKGVVLTIKAGTPGTIAIAGQADQRDLFISGQGTSRLQIRGIGLGQTDITAHAGDINSNSVVLKVSPKLLFQDNVQNNPNLSGESFERQGFDSTMRPELAVNTPGSAGNQRITYAAFRPESSFDKYRFQTLNNQVTLSGNQATASPHPFTVQGISGGQDFIFAAFDTNGDGDWANEQMVNKLRIAIYPPKGPYTVGFHAVNGSNPSSVAIQLTGANLPWRQANISFVQSGPLRTVTVPGISGGVDLGPNGITLSAEQRAIVDKSTRTASINVYFVNSLFKANQNPNTVTVGNQVDDGSGGPSYIFISMSEHGDNADTLAHELGHALGLPDISIAKRLMTRCAEDGCIPGSTIIPKEADTARTRFP